MSTASHSETVNAERAARPAWVWLALAAVLVSLGAVALWSVVNGRLPFVPPAFHGVLMQSPQPVTNFTLTAHTGEEVSLNDFRGQVVLLYFGYTFCPDACPATMNELKTMREALGDRADRVQVLMVSVDPERDTPEALGDYLAHFDDSFLGLTGSEEQILAAATPLGVYYARNEGSAATGYLVDHTTSLVAVDKDGYLRLIYSHGTPGEDIAEDMRYLTR